MAEAGLQRQLVHPALPHRRFVRVSQRVRGDVRGPDPEPVAAAGEPADQRRVAQGEGGALPAAADQEHERGARVGGALVQDVAADRAQGPRVVQSTTRSRRDFCRTPLG